MSFHQSTIKQLQQEIQRDPGAARKIAEDLSARVEAVDPKIKAYINFSREPWQKQLAELEKTPAAAKNKPLWGIPISVKDNICTSGWKTTCASRILEPHIPYYDATVIQRLKNAGAIVFAKCNMDEFAFGSSCETSCFGGTLNPWDVTRVPGGSSGGSAASVAADSAIASLGSDTGGSIRQPASFSGVVGLKPTYGRVSRYGLIAFGSSLDQIGPFAKTVEDAAILMNVMSGHDTYDSTSAAQAVPDYTRGLNDGVKGLKIGLPKEYFIKGLDKEVEQAMRKAADKFASMGAEIQEVSLPHTEYAVAVYYIVAVAEASSNLGRFDGVRYGLRVPANNLIDMYFATRDAGFGAEAKRRILLGTFVLSAGYYEAYYLKGQKVRTLIKQDFERAFEKVDLILTPVAPTPAFKKGEKAADPLSMYLSDIYTIPANLAGVPGISIPAGFSSNGLPIGMQLMGKYFSEDLLFRAAHAFEQNTEFHKQRPKL